MHAYIAGAMESAAALMTFNLNKLLQRLGVIILTIQFTYIYTQICKYALKYICAHTSTLYSHDVYMLLKYVHICFL